VTPSALKGNVWFFDGNSPASEKDLGTNNDFDVPIIRNNVEKLRFDHVTWTTSSHTTNMKIGTNGNAGVVRFPYNSSVQHGIVSTTTGTLSFIIADGESSVATIVATPITIPSNGYVGIGATPSVPFDNNLYRLQQGAKPVLWKSWIWLPAFAEPHNPVGTRALARQQKSTPPRKSRCCPTLLFVVIL
jgi:hypothetical protein